MWIIASVYSSETPTKSLGMLTHPFTLAYLASQSTDSSSSSLLLTALFCRVVCSLSWSLLLTNYRTLLSSSSSGLVGNFARKPFVWVYPHPHSKYPTSCHRISSQEVCVCYSDTLFMCYCVRGGFYAAFRVKALEMELLLAVCGLVVNIGDNLVILFSNDIV